MIYLKNGVKFEKLNDFVDSLNDRKCEICEKYKGTKHPVCEFKCVKIDLSKYNEMWWTFENIKAGIIEREMSKEDYNRYDSLWDSIDQLSEDDINFLKRCDNILIGKYNIELADLDKARAENSP